MENYKIIAQLGRGGFGKVFKVEDKNKDLFALKKIDKMSVRNQPFLIAYIKREIQLHLQLTKSNIPYICKLIRAYEDKDNYCFLMELCEGGNLQGRLKQQKDGVMSLEGAVLAMVDVLKGLRAIHNKNILHRDLKLENVLYSQSSKVYKIIDFGFSKKQVDGVSTILGTQYYMAYEIHVQKSYGFPVDVWALGVIFYYLLFGQFPFKPDFRRNITNKCKEGFSILKQKQGLRPSRNKSNLDETQWNQLQVLFKGFFDMNHQKRITIDQIIQNQLFQKYFTEQQKIESKIFYKKKAAASPKKAEVIKPIEEQPQEEQYQSDSIIKVPLVILRDNQLQQEQKKALAFFENCNFVYSLAQRFNNTRVNIESTSKSLMVLQSLLVFRLLARYLILKHENKQPFTKSINKSRWLQIINSVNYEWQLNSVKRKLQKSEETINSMTMTISRTDVSKLFPSYKLDFKDIQSFDQIKKNHRLLLSLIFQRINVLLKGKHSKDIHNQISRLRIQTFFLYAIDKLFLGIPLEQNFGFLANKDIRDVQNWLQSKEFDEHKKFIQTTLAKYYEGRK